jgi:MMP 1-O-methyltransferase
MPEEEGRALYEAALGAGRLGPLLEVGSYRGKSTIYLGAAALRTGTQVFTVDHHRGSEEHQPGEEFHDRGVYDEQLGRIDTLPSLLRTIERARLSPVVAPLIGRSKDLATGWSRPLGLVFIDGGHSEEAARDDYEGWAPHVVRSGALVIHDVFESPDEGGRPPFNIFRRALDSGSFVERSSCGSLRVLERIGDGI